MTEDIRKHSLMRKGESFGEKKDSSRRFGFQKKMASCKVPAPAVAGLSAFFALRERSLWQEAMEWNERIQICHHIQQHELRLAGWGAGMKTSA